VKPCQPVVGDARFFLSKINRQANYLSKEAVQKRRKKPVTFSCYKLKKKVPISGVVLWKFIIEMSLISRCTLLTIRFTVLLQDVTR
jgi:CRISPR/Cas system endoribonuclease Cas6 (RAMP superfamily)